jgi:NADH:ubiquinone oxidoreductase subunit C
MEKTAILSGLAGALGDGLLAADESRGMPVLAIKPEALLPLARTLREQPYGLGILLDLTCLDDPGSARRFTLVYHFASFVSPSRLRVRIPLEGSRPDVDSLTSLWPNAGWLEREVFDLFGIGFRGHPDLRRLLLYEGFEGHPLRKDYPLRKHQSRLPEAVKP